MRIPLYLTLLCLGTWGLLSGLLYPAWTGEIFLGMVAPWLVGLLTLTSARRVWRSDPAKLTSLMGRGLVFKMVFYGLYVAVILSINTLKAYPFIFSFVGYFIVLHGLEAFILRSTFKKDFKTSN